MREGWEYKKLGEVASIKSGKSIDAKNISSELQYPCYGGNGIRGYVQQYSYEGSFPIIGRVGALCGNVHLANGRFYATEHALVVELKNKNVNSLWLTYNLKSLNLRNIAKGVAQPVIAAKEVAKIIIPIPPLSEQQRIVEELDLLSSIIEKKKAQLKELDSLAQSIFYDMFGDPVTNEKGWEMKKLDRICSKITDGTHDTPARLDKGIKFITGKHIRPFFIDYDNSDYVTEEIHKEIYQRCNPEFGDVLYTNIGAGIGNAAINIVEYEFSMKNVALLKPHKGIVSGYYIEYYLNNEIIKTNIIDNYSNGGAQKFLSLKSISKIPIPLPPLPLQQQFAEKVEAIEQQKELIKQSIKEVETLFNSRMDYYFDG